MKLYHTTAKRNRGAIRRYGLIPRDTLGHNYPEISPQPIGVFCTGAHQHLFRHGVNFHPHMERWRDVWEIDAEGLPFVPDRVIDAQVITCRVEPDRLRRLTTLDASNPLGWPTPEQMVAV